MGQDYCVDSVSMNYRAEFAQIALLNDYRIGSDLLQRIAIDRNDDSGTVVVSVVNGVVHHKALYQERNVLTPVVSGALKADEDSQQYQFRGGHV